MIDVPAGKRVMIESTIGLGVCYSFQDEYGKWKSEPILSMLRIPSAQPPAMAAYLSKEDPDHA